MKYANAPICVQLIGRTSEEEGVIGMGEILDSALKAKVAKSHLWKKCNCCRLLFDQLKSGFFYYLGCVSIRVGWLGWTTDTKHRKGPFNSCNVHPLLAKAECIRYDETVECGGGMFFAFCAKTLVTCNRGDVTPGISRNFFAVIWWKWWRIF